MLQGEAVSHGGSFNVMLHDVQGTLLFIAILAPAVSLAWNGSEGEESLACCGEAPSKTGYATM